jgi:hypothetical protein
MFVRVHSVFVLSCVYVAVLLRADLLSEESYRLCIGPRKGGKAAKAQQGFD